MPRRVGTKSGSRRVHKKGGHHSGRKGHQRKEKRRSQFARSDRTKHHSF